MHRILRRAFLLMVLPVFGCMSGMLVATAHAQQTTGNLPHLADLMNEAMQVHHTKLWYAGHANNWALAAYEVRKIKETIAEIKEKIVDIQVASPQWQNVPVGEMLRSFDSSLDALDQVVKERNAVKFEIAYRDLTATCNACHSRASQPQIKIIQPLPNGGISFPDQDFNAGNAAIVL